MCGGLSLFLVDTFRSKSLHFSLESNARKLCSHKKKERIVSYPFQNVIIEHNYPPISKPTQPIHTCFYVVKYLIEHYALQYMGSFSLLI